jgi:hypothetical protein
LEIFQILTKLMSHITIIWNTFYISCTSNDMLSFTISCYKMKSKKQRRQFPCWRRNQFEARQYNNHNNVIGKDQNKHTFETSIVCYLLIIRKWWFWMSSQFFGCLRTMQSGCAGSSRITNVGAFMSNLLYYVIRLLISWTWMFDTGW